MKIQYEQFIIKADEMMSDVIKLIFHMLHYFQKD